TVHVPNIFGINVVGRFLPTPYRLDCGRRRALKTKLIEMAAERQAGDERQVREQLALRLRPDEKAQRCPNPPELSTTLGHNVRIRLRPPGTAMDVFGRTICRRYRRVCRLQVTTSKSAISMPLSMRPDH